MSGLVVCFSGRIASGKTHITHMLAEALQWPRAGFSDYLRIVLAKRGDQNPSREALQNLGQIFVTRDPDQFCRDVFAQADFAPGGNLLLDGIRHVDIQQRVVKLAIPSRTCLIHLEAEDEVVTKRARKRGASEMEFRRAEAHVVERDLAASLPQIADAIVDAGQPIATVLAQCLAVLERHGGDVVTFTRATGILTRP